MHEETDGLVTLGVVVMSSENTITEIVATFSLFALALTVVSPMLEVAGVLVLVSETCVVTVGVFVETCVVMTGEVEMFEVPVVISDRFEAVEGMLEKLDVSVVITETCTAFEGVLEVLVVSVYISETLVELRNVLEVLVVSVFTFEMSVEFIGVFEVLVSIFDISALTSEVLAVGFVVTPVIVETF